nr:TlpA disulfide reductase family protein [uncultured Sphingomonas sp.]
MRLIVPFLVLGLLAGCDKQKPAEPQSPANGMDAPSQSAEKGIDRTHKGEAAPVATFKNPDGGDMSLVSFKGTPVLVNLWASWCAPCIKELPTLQKLEEEQAGNGALGVIAVSQDMAPKGSVDAFLKEKGIARFAAYHDPDMNLSSALGVQVMPTTILYDARGMEVWRYTGDLDWTGPEARALLAEAGARD